VCVCVCLCVCKRVRANGWKKNLASWLTTSQSMLSECFYIDELPPVARYIHTSINICQLFLYSPASFACICTVSLRVGDTISRCHCRAGSVSRVGQNHMYTVYLRYSWRENYQLYSHIQCVYTVLANHRYDGLYYYVILDSYWILAHHGLSAAH
jgi:hypothetical protein